jgi:hypothetical protein
MTDTNINVKTTIDAKDYDELRDKLSGSGIFDMSDCSLEIYCPELATTKEIERMVSTIESMIHVVDVRVSATPETSTLDHYKVEITEIRPKGYKARNDKRDRK